MTEVTGLQLALLIVSVILGVSLFCLFTTARELSYMTKRYAELTVKYTNLHSKAIAWIPRSHMEEVWKS